MMIISESGMQFKHDSKLLFNIEKSEIYKKLNNVKTVEFLLNRNNAVWFVEAKTSAPNPTNANNADFYKYLDEIYHKMLHSLLLYMAIRFNRFSGEINDMPRIFSELDMQSVGVKFILVIKNQKPEWLPPLQDALAPKFLSIAKILKVSAPCFAVMNEEMARNAHLIA